MTQTIVPIQDVVSGASGTYASLADANDATYVALDLIEVGSDHAVFKLGQVLEPAAPDDPVVTIRKEREEAGTIDLLVELRQGYVSEASPGTLIGDATYASVADAVSESTFTATDNPVTYVGGVATPALYLRFVESIPGASGTPTLTNVTPSSGPEGTIVTLTGTNFVVGATDVNFDTEVVDAADVTVTSATSATCAVPPDLLVGTTDVSVTTAGGTSGTQTFTLTWEPVLVALKVDDGNSDTYALATDVDYLAGWLYLGFSFLNEGAGAAKAGELVGTSQTWTRVEDDGVDVSGAWSLAAFRFAPGSDVLNADTDWDDSLNTGHDGFIGFIVGIPPGWETGGTNGSLAIGVVEEIAGSGTSVSAALAGLLTDSIVVGVVAHANNEANTVTGGYSEISDQQSTGPSRSAVLLADSSSPGSAPGATWTTSANRRLLTIEVLRTTGGGGGDAPTLASVGPNGPPTSIVELVGTNFVSGDTIVHFGGVDIPEADVDVTSSTTAEVAVPHTLTAGSVNVSVETPDGTSSTVSFTVTWEPVLVAAVVDDNNGDTYPMGTFTYYDDWLYFAFGTVNEGAGNAQAGSFIGTSQTWTRVTDDGAAVAGAWGLSAFRFAPTADVVSQATSWDDAGDVGHEGFIGFIVAIPPGFLTGGTNGSAAIGDVDEATGSGTSIAATLSGLQSDSIVLAVVFHANANLHTPSGGYASMSDQAGAGPNRAAVLLEDHSSPGTAPGASWTTSGNARVIAIEVFKV